jgi:hypothetical protein
MTSDFQILRIPVSPVKSDSDIGIFPNICKIGANSERS